MGLISPIGPIRPIGLIGFFAQRLRKLAGSGAAIGGDCEGGVL